MLLFFFGTPCYCSPPRLLSDVGLPLLISHGTRFKIRKKYKDQAEKNLNAKQNLADLMRLYQTWAHNLFPKATFKDFITQAESRCAKEKQLRATMEGWRRAYWDHEKEKKQAMEDADQADKDAEDRRNNVWNEHEKGLQAGSEAAAMTMDYDTGDAEASSSRQGIPVQPLPPTKPITSRKGKERATDDPGASMRLVISDDEDQEDYEAALNRMRISANQDNRKEAEKAQVGHYVGEIDLDKYSDDEDEDDEPPLFTHRALELMGGLKGLEARHGTATVPKAAEPSDVQDMEHDPVGPSQVATLELTQSLGDGGGDSAPEPTLTQGDKTKDVDGTIGIKITEEDNDDVSTSQRPSKARRAIVLGDSDEE
ncbi:replication fork protection component Swi3-domain-containing protein [Mortierella sp. GBAus27b]|nr:replication fork protection component Swi3-domain-containing protein [Mortierella sp. GBAus27b]